MMPNGEQFDIDVSHKLAEHLGIKSIVVNIKDAYEGIVGELAKHFDSFEGQARVNLPPRLRMAALYAVSQTVSYTHLDVYKRQDPDHRKDGRGDHHRH